MGFNGGFMGLIMMYPLVYKNHQKPIHGHGDSELSHSAHGDFPELCICLPEGMKTLWEKSQYLHFDMTFSILIWHYNKILMWHIHIDVISSYLQCLIWHFFMDLLEIFSVAAWRWWVGTPWDAHGIQITSFVDCALVKSWSRDQGMAGYVINIYVSIYLYTCHGGDHSKKSN